jgi:hypothetical protein
MSEHNNGVNTLSQHSKDTELQAVFELLKKQPATATQAAVALNIYRPNLCRRKRTLEKLGLLSVVKKVRCPITKHTAWQLTTNPEYFPNRSQLKFNF